MKRLFNLIVVFAIAAIAITTLSYDSLAHDPPTDQSEVVAFISNTFDYNVETPANFGIQYNKHAESSYGLASTLDHDTCMLFTNDNTKQYPLKSASTDMTSPHWQSTVIKYSQQNPVSLNTRIPDKKQSRSLLQHYTS